MNLRFSSRFLPKTQYGQLVVASLLLSIPALVIVLGFFSFFLRAPSSVFFDEGYTVALAERIISGRWLPYVDGCSHRGPMLYWLVAISEALTGRYNWMGPRVLMLVFSLIVLGAMWGIGFAARIPLAGAVAGIVWAYLGFAAHEVESAVGVIAEPIAAGFGLLSLLFCTVALLRVELPRNRWWWLGASGACAALAGLTKQTALPIAAPIGLWILGAALSLKDASRRQKLALVGSFVAGFAVPILVVVVRYLLAGELHTFWYWFYTYNRKVYMAPYASVPFKRDFDAWLRGNTLMFFLIAASATWGLARPLMELKSWRELPSAYEKAGLDVTSSALVLIVFAAIASPQRFWAPYFILLLPFLSLAIGIQVSRLMDRGEGAPWARLIGVLVLGAMLSGWVGYTASNRLTVLRDERRAGRRQPALPEPVCERFDQYSQRYDDVFIWGFDGDFYITCKRHPATRFTYLTLVAGTVPPFWNDLRADRQARNARRDILSDLHASKPKVVLNSPGTMRNIGIHVVPELTAWLREEYCSMSPVVSKDGRRAEVWVRRDLASCDKP